MLAAFKCLRRPTTASQSKPGTVIKTGTKQSEKVNGANKKLLGVIIRSSSNGKPPEVIIKTNKIGLASSSQKSRKTNGADNKKKPMMVTKKTGLSMKPSEKTNGAVKKTGLSMMQSEKNNGAAKNQLVSVMKKTLDEEDEALPAECRKIFMNNRVAWEKLLPMGNSGQSWLVGDFGEGGSFEVRCLACQAAKKDNEFARGVKSLPILGNLKRHHCSRMHKEALAHCGWGEEVDIKAPETEQFQGLLKRLRQNTKQSYRATGHPSTEVKLRECLVASMWLHDQEFLKRSVSIALHQDVKRHHLYIRFRACCDDLTTHRGLLGGTNLKTDSGSESLVQAVESILRTFCTLSDGRVDEALLKHIKDKVELLNADGASDEQVSLSPEHTRLQARYGQNQGPHTCRKTDSTAALEC